MEEEKLKHSYKTFKASLCVRDNNMSVPKINYNGNTERQRNQL